VEAARAATAADLDRIVELARGLRAELGTYRGGELWGERDVDGEPLADAFGEVMSDARATVVVGTLDRVVVGYGIMRVEVLRDESRLALVPELFVEPEARGVGVGEAIMDALVARARELECRGVDVVALPGHRAAKNFFEEHGFTARAIVMHHALAPDAET
jgi:ribosomal protein S18 acetylase RimI-like enzyme